MKLAEGDVVDVMVDDGASPAPEAEVGRVAAAFGVRANEIENVRALFIAAALLGFGLVFFFSASNALFLVDVGIERLPWVYIVNAPIVIVAGLLYAAWSRRTPVAVVLNLSTVALALSVLALWIWTATSSSSTSSFALATWYRFLFVFSVLGLWEVASAQFDVRQAKRLFPVIAVGMMFAFMVGGGLVSPLTSLVGTTHLIGISAIILGLYAAAFSRTVAGCDFDAADDATPATPREIVAESFSRNLAIMRSITILLIFVTEFIFYEQVAATFETEGSIARFLGVFMALATLAMVLVTALLSGRYIARYGIRIGLMTMPAGLMVCALLIGIYGLVRGPDAIFFALVIFANFASLVLANAIETPVGAVLYQPMPVERRMPVRVAVDGWLGSVALLGAGLLLLVVDVLPFDTVVPFAWVLAVIGAVGLVVAARLYADYKAALSDATTLAFSGVAKTGADVAIDGAEVREALRLRIGADDPAGVLAAVSLANELEDDPMGFVLADLMDSSDRDVAAVAISSAISSATPLPGVATKLTSIVQDPTRPVESRVAALRGLLELSPRQSQNLAATLSGRSELDALTIEALAVDLSRPAPEVGLARLQTLAASTDPDDRVAAGVVVASVPRTATVGSALGDVAATLLADECAEVIESGVDASAGRLQPRMIEPLVALGRQPHHRRAVVNAMAAERTLDLPDLLQPHLDGLPERFVVDLVDDVYASQTRSPHLLHGFLTPERTSTIRRAGFDAMRTADVNLPATVPRMLRDDLDFTRLVTAAHRDTAASEPALLGDALDGEFHAAQAAIFAGLRLVGDSDRVFEIEQVIAHAADDEQRANGIEALDTLLDAELRRQVIPVLEPKSIGDAVSSLSGLEPERDREHWLRVIATSDRFTRATRALAEHHRTRSAKPTPDHAERTPDMSTEIERMLALKRVDIFASLPYDLLVELASVVQERSAAIGETVIEEGDHGDELFALVEGEVAVDGGVRVTLEKGAVFGELALLAPAPRSATVTAVTACEFLVLSRSMLLTLTAQRPEVMAEIAKVLAMRLQSAARTTIAGDAIRT